MFLPLDLEAELVHALGITVSRPGMTCFSWLNSLVSLIGATVVPSHSG